MQRTIASIIGLGVKYCPAPLLVSSAIFCNKPSYISPLTSEDKAVHVSPSIILIILDNIAGVDILFIAPE